MKANPDLIQLGDAYRRRQGIALLMVLGSLVFLSALILAFLASTTTELQSSKSYAHGSEVKQLSEMAVNIVLTQIRLATSCGTTKAWASQPGAIRTYDNITGGIQNVYKLYSSDKMIVNGSFSPSTEVAALANWYNNTAFYTDLNEPIRGNGSILNYPILDPSAQNKVEGFSLTSTSSSVVGGATPNAAAMPARWLYVLRDGQVVNPTGTGITADVAGATTLGTGPTLGNPIVARIAFWTDDETCKVNINTAAEGTFWDVPRFHTDQDVALAKCQPTKDEFQRYPGHPAMTSLAPILFATNSASTPALSSAQMDALYSLTPRINGGGSQAGTKDIYTSTSPARKTDRLYASVDEMIFSVTRSSQDTLARVDQSMLERARFFLTANSRAPETTLFNTPRICVWPIDANTSSSYRTAIDSLIAFCSTINGKPYYFVRTDPKSATADFPGSPTTILQTGLGRNLNLYAYLQYLTAHDIPGFGGNFGTKYGLDCDQIITEIFDYIRTINLDDGNLGQAYRYCRDRGGLAPGQVTPIRITSSAGVTQGIGRFPLISEIGLQFICSADAAITNSNVIANKSLNGVLLTANQRKIEAILLMETFIPGQAFPTISGAVSIKVSGMDAFSINGGSLNFPAVDTLMGSFANITHALNVGGVSSPRRLMFGCGLRARGGYSSDGGSLYPFVSDPITVDASTGTMTFSGGTITVQVFNRTSGTSPGYLDGVVNPVHTMTISFPTATIPVPRLVTTGTSGSRPTTQENWWTFQSQGVGLGAVPFGRLAHMNEAPGGASATAADSGAPFRFGDVVRTMVPATSDFRLLAASSGTSAFTMSSPLYTNSTAECIHNIMESRSSNFFFGFQNLTGEVLAKGVTNYESKPNVANYESVACINGDWDNGLAYRSDGAYCNKAEEGTMTQNTSWVPYFDNEGAGVNIASTGPTSFFSANRQIPSAGMFGSLPTGVKNGNPWRTLLFRPQAGHFGESNPPDHLWLDLFWMPVVEPYAISEPFSTAGKINMNYQIVPYTYIRRAIGMAALLRAERVTAIPSNQAQKYKDDGSVHAETYRQEIDIPETLSQFDTLFAGGGLFRSSSQICEKYLVPKGQTVAGMSAFWTSNSLTGDNVRERPYTDIVGRLTTKSNTYTVHYRVQTLQKPAVDPRPGQWVEGAGCVTGEYRGSTTIERYIDPNDPSLPDFATTQPNAVDAYYKFRVVNTKQFIR